MGLLDGQGQGVLHHAARGGAGTKAWAALLAAWSKEKDSGVDPRDRWRRTPLHWSALNGHAGSVSVLLEVECIHVYEYQLASTFATGADVCPFAWKARASPKEKDEAGETPLNMAERRAKCSASEREPGVSASVFGGIAKLLGGSGATKNLRKG